MIVKLLLLRIVCFANHIRLIEDLLHLHFSLVHLLIRKNQNIERINLDIVHRLK